MHLYEIPFHAVMIVKARSRTAAEEFVAGCDGAYVDNDGTLEECEPDPRPTRRSKKEKPKS